MSFVMVKLSYDFCLFRATVIAAAEGNEYCGLESRPCSQSRPPFSTLLFIQDTTDTQKRKYLVMSM
jgi:hypothetical protein